MKKGLSKKTSWFNLPSIPTVLECPRCNSKLRQLFAGAALPQIYLCSNCGYRGPIGLRPEEHKKKVKKT